MSLQPAPEFGSGGAWPPVATDWVPLSWALFLADPSDRDPDALAATALSELHSQDPESAEDNPLRTEDVLRDDFLYEAIFDQTGGRVPLGRSRSRVKVTIGLVSTIGISTKPDPLAARGELRRLVRSTRWRRNDPVTQLPPGATHEMTHSVTTGLSVEYSQKLADSLGLSLGGNVSGIQARLSSQVQQEFGLSLDITSQEQHSTTLTLTNPSDTRYRVFALWHVDQRISVDALTVWTSRPRSRLRPAWESRGSLEFVVGSDPYLTNTEISRTLPSQSSFAGYPTEAWHRGTDQALRATCPRAVTRIVLPN